jgi:peptide/nickel transport system substrate-binding protein
MHTTLRRLGALLLPCALGLAWAQNVPDPGTLNFGIYFGISNIDPHAINDWAGMWIDDNVYETLVRYRSAEVHGKLVGTSKLQPWLAKSYRVSKNGRTYTFDLRSGVKFHHGGEMTAQDVQFSLDRVLEINLAPAQALKTCLDPAGIQVTGPLQLTVHLKSPCPYFLQLLALPNTGSIVSKSYVMAHGGVQPGKTNRWMTDHEDGTGAFLLSSWKPGVKYVLKAFSGYWGQAPKLKEVAFREIPSVSSQYLLLKQGKLDVIYNPASDLVAQAAHTPNLRVREQPVIGNQILYMNNQKKPFNSVLVRQAVMYALNPEQISLASTGGVGSPAHSAFPKDLPGYSNRYWPYRYDPAKAKALLAKAGYPSGFSTTVYYNSGNSERQETAVTAQAELAAVGIHAQVRSMAWPSFVNGFQTGTMPMFVVSNLNPPIPQLYVDQNFVSSSAGAGGNYAFYKNAQLDALAKKLDLAVRPAAQQQLMNQIQQLLAKTLPEAFLYNESIPYLQGSWVHGWALYPAGDWYFNSVYKGN